MSNTERVSPKILIVGELDDELQTLIAERLHAAVLTKSDVDDKQQSCGEPIDSVICSLRRSEPYPALSTIRAEHADVPLIVVTATAADRKFALKALSNAECDFISDASDSDHFIATLVTSLRISKSLRELKNECSQLNRNELEERSRSTNQSKSLFKDDLQNPELLRVTLSSIGDGVLATDLSGRVTFLNKVAEELTGWNQQDAQGQPITTVFNIVNEETERVVENPISRVLREGIIVGLANHTVLISRDGRKRPIDDSAAPIRDRDGKVIGAVLVFRDISEKKRAEAEIKNALEQASKILESISDAFVAFDRNWCYTYVNARAEALLGRTKQQLLGKCCWDLYPDTVGTEIHSALLNAMKNNEEASLEMFYPGHQRWYDIRAYPSREGISLYFRNVTEARRMTEALRRSEEQFRAVFTQAAAGIAIADLNGRFEQVNRQYCEMFGFTPEDFNHQTILGLTHPADLEITEANMRQLLAGEVPSYALEKRFVRKDGSILWGRTSVTLLKNSSGESAHLICVLEDISSRRQAEQLKAEQAKLIALRADVSAALASSQPTTDCLKLCSEALVRHLDVAFASIWTLQEGSDTLELKARAGQYTQLDGPHSRIRVGQYKIGRIASTKQPHITNTVSTDPEISDQEWAKKEHMVAFAGYPLMVENRVLGVVAMFSRTTFSAHSFADLGVISDSIAQFIDRRRAEESARAQAELIRVTLSSIGDGVLATDARGSVTFLNAVAQELTGWAQEDAAGKPITTVFNIVNEETEQVVENPVNRVLREGKIVGLANHTLLISKDGTRRPIDDSAAPIRDAAGNVVGSVLVFRDITERKEAEAAEKKAAEQTRTILNSISDAFVSLDRDWRYTYVNGQAEALMARKAEDLLGKSVWEAYPDVVGTALEERLRDAAARTAPSSFEIFYPGHQRWYDVRAYPSSGGLSLYYRDVTGARDIMEALRQSEERFRAIFDQAAVGIAIANLEGRFEQVNPRFCEILGYTPAELLKLTYRDITHADDQAITQDHVKRLMEGKVAFYKLEKRYLRKGGTSVLWSITTVTFLRDAEGNIKQFIGVIEDITQRKQVERALAEEARLLELLNSTGQAIASSLDLAKLVDTIRNAATLLTAAQTAAFLLNNTDNSALTQGLSSPSVLVERFGIEPQSTLCTDTLREGKVLRFSDVSATPLYLESMSRKAVKIRSYLAVPIIARTGEVLGGLFFGHIEPNVFTERTERLALSIAAQAAIAIDNGRLYAATQKELAERKRAEQALETAKNQAEQANRAKDEFLAIVSHELRTPLTSMLGWARMLKTTNLPREKAQYGIEVIERNVSVQAQLIADLLDVSRISTGKLTLDLRPTNLLQAINGAIESVRTAAETKLIQITFTNTSSTATVLGDSGRLQQVFWNLLSNAIKFTGESGRIDIRLEQLGELLVVTITDTGKGIRKEFLPHLFQRFQQDDSGTTRRHGGLGLGLSIVRHLVEMHGGRVSASSDGEGTGSKFTVEVPISRHTPVFEKSLLPPVGGLSPQPLKGVSVVVIEDEADSRDLVIAALEMAGASCTGASSVSEAMPLINRIIPLVVVSDIGMPVQDGYAFIRALRQHADKQVSTIRTLALTAFAREEDKRAALNAGFDDYASKPIDPQDLISRVARLSSSRG